MNSSFRVIEAMPLMVMAAMLEWWHEGYLRKYYDKPYKESSSEEENDEEEVNDEESSEKKADNCPPRSKKKKIGAMFNPETCSIELRRGVVFPITEEDVARVLGMPIGDTPVPTKSLESHRQKIEEDFKGGFKGIEISRLENVIWEGQTDGSEVLINIEGAKWPLTCKEFAKSFRPRGLVCRMSNLLVVQSDEFNNVLQVDCDPIKVVYDVLKCEHGQDPTSSSVEWREYCSLQRDEVREEEEVKEKRSRRGKKQKEPYL
ncbi:hypothetical protein RHMOL_Rhmol11G0111200 [Rhododendron molle]|uniref:Uncharacterized protein n=1 Tax=Rhododendron molle TaxID=49168 RepID=A0ACC0LR44_RHOML|nr:hypothetical protein RHMOL_Rhmol11G0111200 [Rhododendron molle]